MLEGAIEPKTIAKQVKKLGSPAAAIVDRNGLYGVMGFSDAAKSEGIQPIIGTLLAVARPADIGPAGRSVEAPLRLRTSRSYRQHARPTGGG